MLIIAGLYAALVWLVFFKLKWLSWGWLSGTVTVFVGLLICAVFVGLLNHIVPTGRVAVTGKVIEVTPNVSGQVIEIPVQPNKLVNANDILFKIDPTPFEAQVRTIEAQLKFQELRLSQMTQLQSSSSGRGFDVEQRQAEVDQLRGQLDKARFELDQTTIRAPANGYVSTMGLEKGERATAFKSVMSFIVSDKIQLVGIFSQNGFQTIKPNADVQFVLANDPGKIYSSTIADVLSGVGEGQVATSGILTRVTSFAMTGEYPALINRPKDIDPSALRPGMSGTATVYAPNSGPLGMLGWILLKARALVLYL